MGRVDQEVVAGSVVTEEMEPVAVMAVMARLMVVMVVAGVTPAILLPEEMAAMEEGERFRKVLEVREETGEQALWVAMAAAAVFWGNPERAVRILPALQLGLTETLECKSPVVMGGLAIPMASMGQGERAGQMAPVAMVALASYLREPAQPKL